MGVTRPSDVATIQSAPKYCDYLQPLLLIMPGSLRINPGSTRADYASIWISGLFFGEPIRQPFSRPPYRR
jgi:hypothetical protein